MTTKELIEGYISTFGRTVSNKQVAEDLKLHRNTVSKWRAKLGLAPPSFFVACKEPRCKSKRDTDAYCKRHRRWTRKDRPPKG